MLDSLPVKGRAPKTGYTREQFGQTWSDDVTVTVTVAGGGNGCDTRNDILARELLEETFKPGTRDCVVLTRVLNDPYTNNRIDFVRGQSTSTAVQIDHVVALSGAWQKGAQQLDEQIRRNLANDPRNPLAVDGPTNSKKSDGDLLSSKQAPMRRIGRLGAHCDSPRTPVGPDKLAATTQSRVSSISAASERVTSAVAPGRWALGEARGDRPVRSASRVSQTPDRRACRRGEQSAVDIVLECCHGRSVRELGGGKAHERGGRGLDLTGD